MPNGSPGRPGVRAIHPAGGSIVCVHQQAGTSRRSILDVECLRWILLEARLDQLCVALGEFRLVA
jgi:hypothetical protein